MLDLVDRAHPAIALPHLAPNRRRHGHRHPYSLDLGLAARTVLSRREPL